MRPQTKYARSGEVNIAYQVVGDGPRDLVYIPGFISNVEHFWDDARTAHFLERLASFSRLIWFDKRGTGLSDRGVPVPTLEQRMDDVRCVMDAVGSERATILGVSEGGPMSALFAATYPRRTTALVLVGSLARTAWAPDYPWGRTRDEFEARVSAIRNAWGTGTVWMAMAPSLAKDETYQAWCAMLERQSASPSAAETLFRMNYDIDARHVLPAIAVPTLILHRTGDPTTKVEHGRYLAEHIASAKYVEALGDDHVPWAGDTDALVDEIEDFLTGMRRGPEPDRVLATVVFTDIVDATRKAVELGDRQWRKLLEQHHAVVREHLKRFRGREIDTAGDGFLAAFDGPTRAVQAAAAITSDVAKLGVTVRAGIHTGECEVMGAKLSGLAVHVGARVASLAGSGEVLVSSTVKDLVAGSGLRFRDRGMYELRGVPGAWQLYAVNIDG
jgi:pimeloyl-ACP methyl ester carboxylesterase